MTGSLGIAAAKTPSTPSAASGPLATADQIAAEALALRILKDPEVQAQRAKLKTQLQNDPVSKTAQGGAGLEHALDLWTLSLALQEIAADPARPKIINVVDDTPHEWFGPKFPGSAVAVDNPDHIYRAAALDGASRYEIRGQRNPNPSAQFSFELTRQAPPPGEESKKKKEAKGDLGNQVGLLRDSDLQIGADGSFTITIDPDPAPGRPNHITSVPGALSLTARDALSDWRQTPNTLQIHRLDDTPAPAALSEAELTRRVVAKLPDYVQFWIAFKNTWLNNPTPNTLVGPYPREGGWGFAASGRYDLGDDEAIVITTARQNARYTGVQLTDAWLMVHDARKALISLNTAQSTPNPDGTYTYVVALRDPGVANWLDTAGFHQGWIQFRWQGLAEGTDGKGFLRSFRHVKLSELKSALPAQVPRVNESQRKAQVAQRTADYAARIHAP
jgi:hypothetical protein